MSTRPLRVILCTNGGLHGALVLQHLRQAPDVQVVGIIRSTRTVRASYGFLRGACAHVKLSGVAYAVYLWCSTSLADLLLGASAVPSRSLAKALPVHTTRDANNAQAISFAKALAPDLLVSAFFNQRIHSLLAAVPQFGAVNIHPSPLPEFRGVDPVFFARLRGAGVLGVSVHRVTDVLDAGNILRQETCPIATNESIFASTARLYERGARLLIDSIDDLTARAPGVVQSTVGHYDSWPSREQVASLRRQGISLAKMSDLKNISRRVTAGES